MKCVIDKDFGKISKYPISLVAGLQREEFSSFMSGRGNIVSVKLFRDSYKFCLKCQIVKLETFVIFYSLYISGS